MPRNKVSKRMLRKLAQQQREHVKVKEQLDKLPPDLRPMRIQFASMLSAMGMPGAELELARMAFVETEAQLRRSALRVITTWNPCTLTQWLAHPPRVCRMFLLGIKGEPEWTSCT